MMMMQASPSGASAAVNNASVSCPDVNQINLCQVVGARLATSLTPILHLIYAPVVNPDGAKWSAHSVASPTTVYVLRRPNVQPHAASYFIYINRSVFGPDALNKLQAVT
ncbi:hypothetical protein Trydic_g1517 [Trypoxylus dichotomus]